MTRNLKTLQIIGSNNPGGAEAYFVRFVRALRAHCEVTAVVKRGSWISEQLSSLDIQHEEMRFGGLFDLASISVFINISFAVFTILIAFSGFELDRLM